PRRPSEGRGGGRAEARRQEHHREAAAQFAQPAELRVGLLRAQRQGRVRRRGDVRVDLCDLHRARRPDAEGRRSLRRQRDGLNPGSGFRLRRLCHRERLLARQLHPVDRLRVLLRSLHDFVVALSFDDRTARTLNHFLHGSSIICASDCDGVGGILSRLPRADARTHRLGRTAEVMRSTDAADSRGPDAPIATRPEKSWSRPGTGGQCCRAHAPFTGEEEGMYVLIVNFNLKDIEEADYFDMCDQVAPAFAGVPGLTSKMWIRNSDTGTYGGVYLFENRDALNRFQESD